jgi:D-lactate dehydrogenase
MKVVFYETEFWDGVYTHKQIMQKLKGHDVKFIRESVNSQNLHEAKNADVVCTFVFSKIAKTQMRAWKKCKLIATMSTGYNHIDLKEARKRKITVCNVPTYGSTTVAEYTIGLILAVMRKIVLAHDKTRKGEFDLGSLRGEDLEKKTLGLVGFGKIGQEVARRAKAFDMEVIAYDPYAKASLIKSKGCKKVSFAELVKKSDVVSLHMPLVESTYHLINKKTIAKMKDGVMIINTARGELIDTNALIEALDSKKFGGVALDVLEGEGNIIEEHEVLNKNRLSSEQMKILIENHILMKERNVLITPHVAFYTREALERITQTTVENILSCIKNKPVNTVK